MRLTRADNSLLAEWWFTVDRKLLLAFLMLMGAGVVLSLAASPALAVRKGLPAFYFVERQLLFAGIGALAMLSLSLLDPRQVRQLGVVLLVLSIGGLIATLVLGPEINGSRRWLRLGGLSLQPSEFAKPGLVVVSAWLLSKASARQDAPALALAISLYAGVAGLILAQPDVGQTLLLSLVWATLFFLCGQPIVRAMLLAAALCAALAVFSLTIDHARRRIVRFLDPTSGDTYQTDRALQSFAEGGLLGRGPGEGSLKLVLPDAHTDFIFAVIGEEFGALACLALVALYAFILARAAVLARNVPDRADRLALIGLAVLVTLQALINMGVNVGLLPTKGMTLPLISAGGSSTLAVSIGAGLLLALTRRRPDAAHVKLPQLGPRLDAAR